MSEQKNNNGAGISAFTLLTLIFITLKLCNVIDWSWWWVLSPAWIPLVLIVLFLIGVVTVAIVIKR